MFTKIFFYVENITFIDILRDLRWPEREWKNHLTILVIFLKNIFVCGGDFKTITFFIIIKQIDKNVVLFFLNNIIQADM